MFLTLNLELFLENCPYSYLWSSFSVLAPARLESMRFTTNYHMHYVMRRFLSVEIAHSPTHVDTPCRSGCPSGPGPGQRPTFGHRFTSIARRCPTLATARDDTSQRITIKRKINVRVCARDKLPRFVNKHARRESCGKQSQAEHHGAFNNIDREGERKDTPFCGRLHSVNKQDPRFTEDPRVLRRIINRVQRGNNFILKRH